MKISTKAVTFQNGWPNYGWNQTKNWVADTGTTLVDNAIEIAADKAAARFTARGAWTGCTDNSKKAPHAVRIVRVNDDVVIATSPTAIGGTDGVVNATAITDVFAGQQFRMEFFSDSAQPGTISPPKSGWLTSDPGTYLEIL
jgi:hypothetical protein